MLTERVSKVLIIGSGMARGLVIDDEPSLTEIIKAHALLMDAPVTVAKVENSKTKSKRGRHNERYGFNKPLAK